MTGLELDRVIGALSEASYSPTTVVADEYPAGSQQARTIEHLAGVGWDAVRDNGDSLTFARFGGEGLHLITTSISGVIASTATFSPDPIGVSMFIAAAELRP